MDSAAVRGLARTARDFCRRHVSPMLAADGKNGDLEQLPALLEEAEAIGLMASSDPDSPGHEYGVWGRACIEDGPTASLVILEEMARTCAGVACCVHAAGLGGLELAGSGHQIKRVAVALLEDGCRLPVTDRDRPPPDVTTIVAADGGVVVLGTKPFVQAVPGWDGCVVYGAGHGGWQRALVRRSDAGLGVAPVGQRMGLAAIECVDLDFTGATVRPDHHLEPRSPWSYLARHLLGLSAIAVGNARAAVNAACEYAEQRFQGGGQIEDHAAVQALIGDAMSRVDAAEAYLLQAAGKWVDGTSPLHTAAAVKLRLTVDCCQAVTDSLQVLGGYGYMEDYGLEKRLRDAMTLKTMSVAPEDLRRMLVVSKQGGGS